MTETEPELDIAFYDSLEPAATAGVYRVEVTQTLKRTPQDTEGIDKDRPLTPVPVGAEFEIRAVQFVLDPSSVHAVFPPSGASGDYARVLPHITLDRAILPWEREPKWSRTPGRAPWLALLMFTEDELTEDPDARGTTVSRTVADLVNPPEEEGKRVLGPALNGLPPETLAGVCRTIDVPTDVFRDVLPTADELRFLTHVRDVKPSPGLLGFEGERLTPGKYAVMASARFPHTTVPGTDPVEGEQRPVGHAVHLVSLEGHDKPLAGDIAPGTTHVRLCSLWSWTFTHDPTAAFDAAGILEHLVAPSRTDPDLLTLRLAPTAGYPTTTATPDGQKGTQNDPTSEAVPPGDVPDGASSGGPPAAPRKPEDDHVRNRLERGYVPVPQSLFSGELGYGWYRGPLTPVKAPAVPQSTDEYTTADHALIYDENHGLFDVSYAAAFTLGRALALADPSYTSQIVRARRELANHAITLMTLRADPLRRDLPTTATRRGPHWLHTLAQTTTDTTLAAALAAPPAPPHPAKATRHLTPPTDSRALLATGDTPDLLRATATHHTTDLPEWITALTRLAGIPYHYLIPDPRMLPPETLRVFAIDPHWISSLTDGATSLALHTTLDHHLNPHLRHALLNPDNPAPVPGAGILIRSRLIPAWPDITVIATTGSNGPTPVTEIRRDRPAPDTLLILFDTLPTHITLREPGQGIHFGTDTTTDGREVLNLRHIQPPGDLGATTGHVFPTTGTLRDYHRPNDRNTLNLLDTTNGHKALIPDLTQTLTPGETLRPVEFALQLTNAPLQQTLTPPDNQDPT